MQLQRATVRLGDRRDDGEPETRSVAAAGSLRADPAERADELCRLVLRQRQSAVVHDQVDERVAIGVDGDA